MKTLWPYLGEDSVAPERREESESQSTGCQGPTTPAFGLGGKRLAMRSGYSTDVQDMDRRYEATESILQPEQKRMLGLDPQTLSFLSKQG